MMSIRKLLICCCVVFVSGCSYPEKQGQLERPGASLISISHLKTFYKGHSYIFKDSYMIKGRVVSTDYSGNYYKTIAVKDDTGAIEIRVDREGLYELYPMGCEVEVYCAGLKLGTYGGALQLGTGRISDDVVEYIGEADAVSVIRMTGEPSECSEPELRTINSLTMEDTGRLVVIEDVQFIIEEGRGEWCDEDPEATGKFLDTNRCITDRNGNTLIVRNSRYAECAAWSLPRGSGRIEGIVSVFNGTFQLKVIRPDIIYAIMSDARF